MEEVIASPFITFLFLLIYIQVTLEAPVPPPTKVGQFCGSKITVKQIFTDNHNWDRYCLLHRGEIRAVEKREVEKMMCCKGPIVVKFDYFRECNALKEYCDKINQSNLEISEANLIKLS